MKYLFMLLLVSILSAPQLSRAQDEPGNILIMWESVSMDGNLYVCIPQFIQNYGRWLTVTVVARAPLEPVNRVRFQMTWPLGLSHDPGVLVYPGAVDLSAPGDDVWDIQLPECYESTSRYPSMPFVDYRITGAPGPEWVCTYGDVVPQPTWTSCSGETFDAPLFTMGGDWEEGCFPSGVEYCPVATQQMSWGTLKASY